MYEGILLIGYELNNSLSKLPHDKEIIIEETRSPLIHDENKSVYSNPIVIKQRESENRVILTVSYFK